jgi:hypothetical protein
MFVLSMFIRSMAIVMIACLITASRVRAQAIAFIDDRHAQLLSTRLAGTDQAEAEKALGEIHGLLESAPEQASGYCRKYWLPSLLNVSRFDQADRLAFDAIVACPWQTEAVESFQETRVQSALRENRTTEALVDARGLFNVAGLRGTEHALSVVAECLRAAQGGDAETLRQFRREELAGATTRPTSQPGMTSAILTKIAIDPSPYLASIAKLTGDDEQSRQGKGNLLLLAGRCAEAKDTFEAMERIASIRDRIAITENVARAIKALDGTIGRANGYMLSRMSVQNLH